MNTEYDFSQLVNTPQLIDEVSTAGLPAFTYMTTDGTSCSIFYATPLTTDQQTTLTTVVANHIANFSYITLAVQTQINTLVSYLNNSNTAVANLARATIVQNLAKGLPLNILTTINTQIAHTLSGS